MQSFIYLAYLAYHDGWYVKPGIFAGYLDALGLKGARVGLGVAGGYGWVWDSGFSLDLGLNLQYAHWLRPSTVPGTKATSACLGLRLFSTSVSALRSKADCA